ncbi:hypothetical protein LINGRAPRIM_LOCUS1847 [Linum grandiflorum]
MLRSKWTLAATKLLQQQPNPNHQHSNLVIQFKEFLRKNWEVQLFHIYRERNCLADYFVGHRHGLPLGTYSVNVSDTAVTTWITYSCLRSSQSRSVLR